MQYAILSRKEYVSCNNGWPYKEWHFATENGLIIEFKTYEEFKKAKDSLSKVNDDYKLIEIFPAKSALDIIASAISEVEKMEKIEQERKDKLEKRKQEKEQKKKEEALLKQAIESLSLKEKDLLLKKVSNSSDKSETTSSDLNKSSK